MTSLADLLLVNGSLALLYTVVPLPAVRRLCHGVSAATMALAAVVCGMASQAVFGTVWQHAVGRNAGAEVCFYLVFWLAASQAAGRLRRPAAAPRQQAGKRSARVLVALLLCALFARSLHPLQTAALGQSEAYAHLLFVKDICRVAQLRNPAYPPGYHWIMAMPVIALRLDAYNVARYGGAFSGLVLTLATYVLLLRKGAATAALGALLIACCPALTLLSKTSVGLFANQFGLALLPVVLFAYVRAVEAGHRGETAESRAFSVLLGLSLAALAVSVSLTFVHAGLFLGLGAVLCAGRWRRATWVTQAALPAIPAILLFAAHFVAAGPAIAAGIAKSMTGTAPVELTEQQADRNSTAPAGVAAAPVPVAESLGSLMRDFTSVKRVGIGNGAMTAAAILLFLLLGAAAVLGFKKLDPWLFLIGLFGTLAAIRTLTGFLEFSRYQRAGWYLLTAAAWLGGILGGRLYAALPARLAKGGAIAVAALFLVATWLWPPRHWNAFSSAEDELVAIVRQLSQRELIRSAKPRPLLAKRPTEVIPAELLGSGPVTLVTRTVSDTCGRRWELADAVMVGDLPLKTVYVGRRGSLQDVIAGAGRYVIVLDGNRHIRRQDIGSFATVSPKQADRFVAWQNSLVAINRRLETLIGILREVGVKCIDYEVSDGALAVVCCVPDDDKITRALNAHLRGGVS